MKRLKPIRRNEIFKEGAKAEAILHEKIIKSNIFSKLFYSIASLFFKKKI